MNVNNTGNEESIRNFANVDEWKQDSNIHIPKHEDLSILANEMSINSLQKTLKKKYETKNHVLASEKILRESGGATGTDTSRLVIAAAPQSKRTADFLTKSMMVSAQVPRYSARQNVVVVNNKPTTTAG